MHEHLDEVGIINMNGRIYDPVLGRFLQPDKIIQEPGNLQNHNRYSYVMNNPLKFTDPSGYRATGPGNSGIPPEHNCNHYVHLKPPVLYVDGIRIESWQGGYAFWQGGGRGGGGIGVATMQSFGVWNGIGPGNKGYSITKGAFIDAGITEFNGSGAYVQTKYLGNNNKGEGIFINPVDGRISINKLEAAAYIQWTEYSGKFMPWSEYEDKTESYQTNNQIDFINGFTYPGVSFVIEERDAGYNNPINNTIHLPMWAADRSAKELQDYMRHEYGHTLQKKEEGWINHLYVILTSINQFGSTPHLEKWCELEANWFSNQYFQKNFPAHPTFYLPKYKF